MQKQFSLKRLNAPTIPNFPQRTVIRREYKQVTVNYGSTETRETDGAQACDGSSLNARITFCEIIVTKVSSFLPGMFGQK